MHSFIYAHACKHMITHVCVLIDAYHTEIPIYIYQCLEDTRDPEDTNGLKVCGGKKSDRGHDRGAMGYTAYFQKGERERSVVIKGRETASAHEREHSVHIRFIMFTPTLMLPSTSFSLRNIYRRGPELIPN